MHSASPLSFGGTGRFHVRARVGQGAVGVVFDAWDDELKIRVALKVLRGVSPEALLALKKDFRAVQDIRHPNLVRTGELFEEGGTWFFTMEFVDGVSLRRYVRPNEGSYPSIRPDGQPPASPRYDEARLRAVLPQLVGALSALHAHGKVHRDVKPSNVLVTEAGRVVLLDFGVVSDLGPDVEGASDDFVGTVAYMAPEQALSEPISPATDWYAVGVILYEALTGRLPFHGPMHELVAKKLKGPPPAPSTLVPGAPRDLDALCVDLLRVVPEARPSEAEILARLGVAEREGPSPGAVLTGGVFVGREGELGALERALADVRRGATVTALVHGESGVGKSFLVRRFLTRVREEHPTAVILAGRCFERESVPYKAVDGVIDQLRDHLFSLTGDERSTILPADAPLVARAFPVLTDVISTAEPEHLEATNPQALRAAMFASLRRLLAAIGSRCPLVVSVDDLQWADKDSLELIADVMRPPDAPRLLLVATIRMATESASRDDRRRIEALELTGDVRDVQVQQLSLDEARALAKALLGASADDSFVDEMVAESKGHPLFIDELARQRSSTRRTKVLRLDDALWQRVTRLERPVQRVLELISVAGLPIAQGVAAEAAGIELGQLSDVAGELRAGHLAKTSGARREDVIEAYHDRVRESVLAHVEPEARALWHGRLAAALERVQSDDAETLAVHWHGAGDTARAAMYAERAADAAMRTLAFERAARLYRSALAGARATAQARVPGEGAITQGDQERTRDLERRLAVALRSAGYIADAAEVNLALAEQATGEQAIDLRRRAAEQLLCSGHFEAGLSLLRGVLAAVGIYFPRSPATVILSVIFYRIVLAVRGLDVRAAMPTKASSAALIRADAAWSAGCSFAMTDNMRGAYFQARNLVLCLRLGDRERVAKALAMEVCFRSSGGRKSEPEVAALLARQWELTREVGTPEVTAMAHAATGYHHFMVGRWAAAFDALAQAETTFRESCIGVTFHLNSVRSMMYRTLASLGRLRELDSRVPPLLREAEKHADLFALANVRSVPLVLLGLRDGDPQSAREELGQANARLPRGAFLIQHYYALLGECLIDLYAGDGAAALERLDAAWPALRRSLLLRVQTVRVTMLEQRARAALSAARSRGSAKRELLATADRATERLQSEKLPWSTALATMFQAGSAAARGDATAATTALESAEQQFETLEMRLYAAACRRRRGAITDGEAGDLLVREADARFVEEGTRDPERMAGIYLPPLDATR
jgi:hypothetical protein